MDESADDPIDCAGKISRRQIELWGLGGISEMRFDDVEEQRTNKEKPNKAMIELGLNFAKGKDNLLVSCRAGQGRSVVRPDRIGIYDVDGQPSAEVSKVPPAWSGIKSTVAAL